MQRRSANWGLFVLTTVNLLNYTDRYVVAALVESLKTSELKLSDAQAGALMSSFIIVYMLISPLFGVLGDRFSRTKLIACGVAIWSFATSLGAFARNYVTLFLARATVGVGEAAYATIAPTLLADYFPPRLRGRIMAAFFAAIPIGSALGYVVGGWFDHHYGWRTAFLVAGLPGLLFAVFTLILSDPPRGIQEEGFHSTPSSGGWSSYRTLFANRSYITAIAGLAMYTFALGGLAFWMPAFLERMRGVPKTEATMQFGSIIVVTGFLGTFVGGWLGDRFLKKSRQSYLWVSGIATLVAIPFLLIALTVKTPAYYLSAMFVAEVFLFVSTGPINTWIVNVVSPQMRAAAMAACTFFIHFFGDVPSPFLIGFISDRSSLAMGVLIVPFAVFLSGLIWTLAAWRDHATP